MTFLELVEWVAVEPWASLTDWFEDKIAERFELLALPLWLPICALLMFICWALALLLIVSVGPFVYVTAAVKQAWR